MLVSKARLFGVVFFVLSIFGLVACGGSGGGSSSVPSNPASSSSQMVSSQSSDASSSESTTSSTESSSSESSASISSASSTTSTSSTSSASSVNSSASSQPNCNDCPIALVDNFPNAIHFWQVSETEEITYEACFAYNLDTATPNLIDTVLGLGGQSGNCADDTYFARCNYFGEDYVEALIQFTDSYSGQNDTSAIASCGLWSGIYTDAEGVVDTREENIPSEEHQSFVRPVYIDVVTVSGLLTGCREIETQGYSDGALAGLLNDDATVLGACPERDYIGACHFLSDQLNAIPMITYWLDVALARSQEVACTQASGTWVSY